MTPIEQVARTAASRFSPHKPCERSKDNYLASRTEAINPATRRRPPSMSVGKVGLLTPSGRVTCKRGTRNAITAADQNHAQAFHHRGASGGLSKASSGPRKSFCLMADQAQKIALHATSALPPATKTSPRITIAVSYFSCPSSMGIALAGGNSTSVLVFSAAL